MLSFAYSSDLQLQETLRDIDRLRSHILTLVLSTENELKLQWEGTTIRTWATLALAGREVPKHHVATILAHPSRPTRALIAITGVRDAYDYIHSSWRANPKPVNITAIQTLYSKAASPETAAFAPLVSPITELLMYLAQEGAHPVIQASIAHLYILALGPTVELGLLSRLTHYLLLAKYGYDLRGYATPDRSWLTDARTYFRLMDEYSITHNMNAWLAFMAESMRGSLDLLSRDITSSKFHIEFPKSFWNLTDRQKGIMKILATPSVTITNRKVQKQFKVSQITASRDLSRLTTLGLVYPHGKGRSVYYSRI